MALVSIAADDLVPNSLVVIAPGGARAGLLSWRLSDPTVTLAAALHLFKVLVSDGARDADF